MQFGHLIPMRTHSFNLGRLILVCFGTLYVGLSSAAAAVLIQVDKSAQQMTVSVDGAQRWTWPVSTGRSGYSTPSGNFKAFRMEEDHYSKEWDDAPMPHSIFFTTEGHAIHGSYETKRLGTAASHGCVRLAPEHAAKLFALVKAEGVTNAKVVITGSEAAAVARRTTPRAPNGAASRQAAQSEWTAYEQRQYSQNPPQYDGAYQQYPRYPQYPQYQYQYQQPPQRGFFPFFSRWD